MAVELKVATVNCAGNHKKYVHPMENVKQLRYHMLREAFEESDVVMMQEMKHGRGLNEQENIDLSSLESDDSYWLYKPNMDAGIVLKKEKFDWYDEFEEHCTEEYDAIDRDRVALVLASPRGSHCPILFVSYHAKRYNVRRCSDMLRDTYRLASENNAMLLIGCDFNMKDARAKQMVDMAGYLKKYNLTVASPKKSGRRQDVIDYFIKDNEMKVERGSVVYIPFPAGPNYDWRALQESANKEDKLILDPILDHDPVTAIFIIPASNGNSEEGVPVSHPTAADGNPTLEIDENQSVLNPNIQPILPSEDPPREASDSQAPGTSMN